MHWGYFYWDAVWRSKPIISWYEIYRLPQHRINIRGGVGCIK